MELKRSEIYTCSKGSQIEILQDCSVCELTCCGETMTRMEEKTADKSTEKHVPVLEKVDGGVKVTVGTTLHPMEEDHFIEWVEIRTADREYKAFLKPGGEPSAVFQVEGEVLYAREHCNKHGLWKS